MELKEYFWNENDNIYEIVADKCQMHLIQNFFVDDMLTFELYS